MHILVKKAMTEKENDQAFFRESIWIQNMKTETMGYK